MDLCPGRGGHGRMVIIKLSLARITHIGDGQEDHIRH